MQSATNGSQWPISTSAFHSEGQAQLLCRCSSFVHEFSFLVLRLSPPTFCIGTLATSTALGDLRSHFSKRHVLSSLLRVTFQPRSCVLTVPVQRVWQPRLSGTCSLNGYTTQELWSMLSKVGAVA